MIDPEITQEALRDTQEWYEHGLFIACAISATVVGALGGATASSRVRMDIFGVVCCGTIAALGGGTLRDIVLTGYTNAAGEGIKVYWTMPDGAIFLYCAIFTSLVVFFITRFVKLPVGTIRLADAFAMALFTILGMSKAQLAGCDSVVSMAMGVCTGVAGGALRDVLTGNVPYVFRPGEFYATAGLIGCLSYLGMQALSVPHWISYFGSVIIIIGLRVAAISMNWQLPTYRPLFEGHNNEGEEDNAESRVKQDDA